MPLRLLRLAPEGAARETTGAAFGAGAFAGPLTDLLPLPLLALAFAAAIFCAGAILPAFACSCAPPAAAAAAAPLEAEAEAEPRVEAVRFSRAGGVVAEDRNEHRAALKTLVTELDEDKSGTIDSYM